MVLKCGKESRQVSQNDTAWKGVSSVVVGLADGGRAQVPRNTSKSRIWKRLRRGLFPRASRRETAADTLVVIQWHRHQTSDLDNCRITCSCCFGPLVCVIYYSNNRKVTRKWTQFERVGSWWTCPSPPSGAKIGCHPMRAWIVNYLVLLEEVKGGCQLCSLSGQIIRNLWEDGGEKSLTQNDYFIPSRITQNLFEEFDKAPVGSRFRKCLYRPSTCEPTGILKSAPKVEHILLKFLTRLQKCVSIFVLVSKCFLDEQIMVAAQMKESPWSVCTHTHAPTSVHARVCAHTGF